MVCFFPLRPPEPAPPLRPFARSQPSAHAPPLRAGAARVVVVAATAAMGGRLTRVFRTFNVESRARREISKEKPTPAPRHPTFRLDEQAGGCLGLARPRGDAGEGSVAAGPELGGGKGRATGGGARVADGGAAWARCRGARGGGVPRGGAGPVTLRAGRLGARGMLGAVVSGGGRC